LIRGDNYDLTNALSVWCYKNILYMKAKGSRKYRRRFIWTVGR